MGYLLGDNAPVDPPKELVVSGLYCFVGNPMYVGGTIILLGWMVWSPSNPLIVALVIFFLAFHLFVLFYEESTLKKNFGAAYEEYRKQVARWIPRFK